MGEKDFARLQIDPEFKALIPPLRKEEYRQLELNISVDGCRESILVWQGVIVDGHNRYAICNRLHIPYAVQEVAFSCREDAIAWICANQLGRRNISEEMRKYLIGKQYEAEKVANDKKNAEGRNQYSEQHTTNMVSPAPRKQPVSDIRKNESGRRTAARLGKQYHLSQSTVVKYERYAQAIDDLSARMPDVVQQVLSGNYKVSFDNLVALSEMDDEALQGMKQKLNELSPAFVRYSESRRNIAGSGAVRNAGVAELKPSIKTMPAYDPDAEVAGLTLTIPSWVSSMERTKKVTDWAAISLSAREGLEKALLSLERCAKELLSVAKEDADG